MGRGDIAAREGPDKRIPTIRTGTNGLILFNLECMSTLARFLMMTLILSSRDDHHCVIENNI
jgi:hypothetical protein